MTTDEFLQRVVTTDAGMFNLCLRSQSGIWHSEYYEWPQQLGIICDTAQHAAPEYDVYFSAHLFSERDAHKEFVLPSKTIQQDLDEADPYTLPLAPNVLINTSPHRYQGFWVLNGPNDLELVELVSKRLAYAIPNCDHSGWPLGHKYRLPDTLNHKYLDGPHRVNIISVSNRTYGIEELELLPDIDSISSERFDSGFLERADDIVLDIGPLELLESIKDRLTAKVYTEYNIQSKDRSASLWALLCNAFRAGATREQVYWLGLHSANNKFNLFKYHAKRELAKDVLRAEQTVHTQVTDIRGIINDMRRQTKELVNIRRRAIYEVVLGAMKQDGEFIKTDLGNKLYIPRDKGHPMFVERNADDLMSALLDIRFGLNRTEPETAFVVNSLNSYMSTLPDTGHISLLSYYDSDSHSLLVHGGRKNVYDVRQNNIGTVIDGAYNVVFLWDYQVEPFIPDLHSDLDWGHVMFGDINNVVNMDPQEIECLLKVWFMFALFRNAANSKPILAFLGRPGSGKTTISRKVYALLYGRHLEVSGLADPWSFDIATTNMPLLVLDNLDTWERWLPDRLAQARGNTDVVVRKLYTNSETVRLHRQAVLVVTAHDPKFGRVDITDGTIIVGLDRFKQFKSERTIIDTVLSQRNKLWGSILHDVQRVLSRPIPLDTDLQMRIEDFARLGEWIAQGLDCHKTFRGLVGKLVNAQQSFNMNEDHSLVQAIQHWLVKTGGGTRHQDQLHKELATCSSDPETFMHRYRNSILLSKRLILLQETLSQDTALITYTLGKGGAKLWDIQKIEN